MKPKEQDKFIIGIDSGGTYTRIRIKKTTGNIRDISNPSAHYTTTGPENFSTELSRQIRLLIREMNLKMSNCLGIAIGGAGLRTEGQKSEVRNLFTGKLHFNNIIVESDAFIALYDAYGRKEGIILICGTGAVLYANYKGKTERVGGWGRAFGDPGSGYYLGLLALQSIAEEYDLYGGLYKSTFSKKIEDKFGIKGENMLELLYHKDFPPAVLVPLILKLASSRNSTAISLIEKTVNELVLFLDIFLRNKMPGELFSVSFGGSLLSNNNFLSGKLKARINKEFKNKLKLTNLKVNPLRGAVKLIESML